MANYTVIVVSRGWNYVALAFEVRESDLHWAKSKGGVRWWLEHTTECLASQSTRPVLWKTHYAKVWEGHHRTTPDRQPDWIVQNTRRKGIKWSRTYESE